MNRLLEAARRQKRGLSALLLVLTLVAAPTAFGFSGGITKDNAGIPDFEEIGCTGCHGPGASGHHDFAAGAYQFVSWSIADEEGNAIAGNVYEADAVYTITIMLDEQVEPAADNKAGFNLRASAGELAGVEGSSQVSGDHTQATHVDAASNSWTVTWTAPHDGVTVFDLFVNDVDGSGAPDEGDAVYRVGWFVTDKSHALPGAAEEEHEVHVGVELPQYWLGLIALGSMIAVILFAFVYLKFMSPHHADQKDR